MTVMFPLPMVCCRFFGVKRVSIGGVRLTLWFPVLFVLVPSGFTSGMFSVSLVAGVFCVESENLTSSLEATVDVSICVLLL